MLRRGNSCRFCGNVHQRLLTFSTQSKDKPHLYLDKAIEQRLCRRAQPEVLLEAETSFCGRIFAAMQLQEGVPFPVEEYGSAVFTFS